MMIFCIIDSISFYEDSARLSDTKKIMHWLTEMVRSDETGPVFKLLMTSSTKIRHLPENVGRGEILNVPREVAPQAGASVLRSGNLELQ